MFQTWAAGLESMVGKRKMQGRPQTDSGLTASQGVSKPPNRFKHAYYVAGQKKRGVCDHSSKLPLLFSLST